MMVIASVIGAFSSVAGLAMSYFLDIASGAAVVLVSTTVFVLAFVFAPRRGLLARVYGRGSRSRSFSQSPFK
jgi:manganese/iron transport system permease protein